MNELVKSKLTITKLPLIQPGSKTFDLVMKMLFALRNSSIDL